MAIKKHALLLSNRIAIILLYNLTDVFTYHGPKELVAIMSASFRSRFDLGHNEDLYCKTNTQANTIAWSDAAYVITYEEDWFILQLRYRMVLL